MYKGSTPTHTFEVTLNASPLDPSLIDEVKITYSQKDKEVIVKRTEDCVIRRGEISVRLSQEDTFKFVDNTIVMIQMRILTTGGDALTSELMMTSVGKCLDDEVLT